MRLKISCAFLLIFYYYSSVALVKVTGFVAQGDIALAPSIPVTSNLNVIFPVCAYNSVNRLITVTASGSGTAGALTISNGLDNIAYLAAITQAGNTNFANLIANTPRNRRGHTGALTEQDCPPPTASKVSQLRIRFPPASFPESLSQGTYTGTLTITVEPR